jgi:phosphate-selective porin
VTARLSTYVSGVGLGVAGSWLRIGGPTRDSVVGVTPGGHRFFAPVPVRGWSQRYEVDAIVDAGPFFVTAEYAWGYQQRKRANADFSDGAPLIAQGAYLTLGWMFIGAPPGSKGPHLPFKDWGFSLDLQRKRLGRNAGAEILVRGEWISIDQARGERDFKGNSAKAITVGLNVYLMENVRFTFEYVRLHIGDQSRAERAHSREADELIFRAQLEF